MLESHLYSPRGSGSNRRDLNEPTDCCEGIRAMWGWMGMMRMRMRADLGRPALRSPDHNFVLRVNPLQLSSCCTKNVVSLGFHKNRKKKEKRTQNAHRCSREASRDVLGPHGVFGGVSPEVPGGPRRFPGGPRRSPEVPRRSQEPPQRHLTSPKMSTVNISKNKRKKLKKFKNCEVLWFSSKS